MSSLTMTRGDDRTFDVDVVDPDSDPPNQPVDISGFPEVWVTAKRRISDTDDESVFQKTLGNGVVKSVEVGEENRASFTVAAADTDDLPARDTRLLWDVQVQDSEGFIVTIASGTLVVKPDVTRAIGNES